MLGDTLRGDSWTREDLERSCKACWLRKLINTDLYQPQANVNANNLQHLTAEFQGVAWKRRKRKSKQQSTMTKVEPLLFKQFNLIILI